MYTVGGQLTIADAITEVQYAPVYPNGSVGAWTNTTPMIKPRSLHAL